MYFCEIPDDLKKKFTKLLKKDKRRYLILFKKLDEIAENPTNYKRLRNKMKGIFRVHIDKSFVLTFRIDEKEKVVYIEDFDHHDKIYQK